MKLLNRFKSIFISVMAIAMFFMLGNKAVYATENNSIKSGIYQIENDVYHESETGMAMSRSYLQPTMDVEVRKDSIVYTISFSGSEFMENYRIKLNGEETPVEVIEDVAEAGTVNLKVEVDKLDADMDALIYVAPMERDVEFKVIPKMETLTLIEAIEEEKVEEEVEEVKETLEETVQDDNEKVGDKSNMNNGMIATIGIIAIVLVVAIMVIKAKKK